MAQEIEGITVKFGADTVEFDKSVNGINKALKLVKNDFKAINNDLKFDSKNPELYKKKLENLEQQLKLVKARNSQFSASLQELGKRTDSNADLFDKLTRKIQDGNVEASKLERSIASLNSHMEQLPYARFDAMGKSLQKVGTNLQTVGKALAPLSLLSGSALVGGIKSAIDFENAFIGVQKTVDATKEKMDTLKQGIIDMATTIPASVDEIGTIAESAGQLGIETDNIIDFTRVMIDLGNTTNISSEEGAMALARFANVTQMSQTDFDRLGSTLVDLGNNFETTENEIMNMASRLAGTGSIVGMSEADILALSTALSSVGIEAEAGGSAMSKLLANMQLSVETNSNALKDFARVSGMSANEFATQFKENAVGALNSFIQGLAKMDASGESAIKVLDEMGIKEVRMRDAILKSVSANETLSSAIGVANNAWEENTALSEEAEKFYGTLSSKLDITKNKLSNMARIIGENVTPLIDKFNSMLQSLTDKFTELSPNTQAFIAQFLLIATAVAPVTIAIGKVVSIVGTLMSRIVPITKTLTAIVGAVNPVSIAIGALIAVFGYAIATNEKVRESLVSIWNQIQMFMIPIFNTLTTVVNTVLKPAFDAIITVLDWLSINVIQPLFAFIANNLMPIFVQLANHFSKVLIPIVRSLGGVVETVIGFFDGLFTITGKLWDAFMQTEWVQALIVFFQDLWGVVENLIDTFGRLCDAISNAWNMATNFLSDVGKGIGDFFGGLFSSGGLGINAELMASGGLGIRNLTINAPINVNNQGREIGASEVNGWIEQIADGVSIVLGRRLV